MADADYKLRRLPDGRYEATILIPVPGAAPVAVTTAGGSRQSAAARAATAAESIANNPILRAVLPPGTGLAIGVIKKLATSKDVKKVLGKLAGPGAKRLAKAFGF